MKNGPENCWCSKIGPEGDKFKKVRTKFHSEAETACGMKKTAARAVMSCKIMLQAEYSGYFTSAASEMSAQNRAEGPKGDKLTVQKFHSEAETAFVVEKTAARAVMSCKTMLQAAKSGYFHFWSF